jgi:hypothetical protein
LLYSFIFKLPSDRAYDCKRLTSVNKVSTGAGSNIIYQSEDSNDLQFVDVAKDYVSNNILAREEW